MLVCQSTTVLYGELRQYCMPSACWVYLQYSVHFAPRSPMEVHSSMQVSKVPVGSYPVTFWCLLCDSFKLSLFAKISKHTVFCLFVNNRHLLQQFWIWFRNWGGWVKLQVYLFQLYFLSRIHFTSLAALSRLSWCFGPHHLAGPHTQVEWKMLF